MSIFLRILLIIVSFLTNYYLIMKIRKSQLQIEDSIFWVAFSFGIAILSIFPSIAIYFSDLIGIESPANLVFLSIIFILLLKVFLMSIKISHLEYKIKSLSQEIALNVAINEIKILNRK